MIPVTIVEIPRTETSLNMGTELPAVPRVGDVLWPGMICDEQPIERPPFVVTQVGWVAQTLNGFCFITVERRTVNA